MTIEERLLRIKTNLIEAKKRDANLEVFGADSHLYELDPPASLQEVKDLEYEYRIELPEEYKAFITTLGNGGPGSYGGAGPYYGIFPLGEFMYMESTAKYMSEGCVINSTMSEQQWQQQTAFDGELSHDSEEYDRQYNQLFSGLMAIGTMGDSGQMMLVLNGHDRGRVVYVNQDLYPPVFKGMFLDWYEKWLDEIVSK